MVVVGVPCASCCETAENMCIALAVGVDVLCRGVTLVEVAEVVNRLGSPIWARSHRFIQESAVNDPFVKMSAICSFVPTCFMNMPGSSRIRSNRKSKSTLWVRGTCCICGLRPLIVI